MRRSLLASLGPQEIDALRRLRDDPRHQMPIALRFLLLSMGLIAVGADELRLTEAGRHRLAMEERGQHWDRRLAGPRPTIH
jgi:hypothetical protein